MKKIIQFCIGIILCLGLSLPLLAQDLVIYRQDFESFASLPTGWSVVSTTPENYFIDSLNVPTISSGRYLYFFRSENITTDTSHLLTPMFDCRTQDTVVVQYMQSRYGVQYTNVSVSNDSGRTWHLVLVDSLSFDYFKTQVLNITNYAAGHQYVQLRFSDLGLMESRSLMLDDFEVINPSAMNYISSELLQTNFDAVSPGDTMKLIGGLKIHTQGKAQPLQLSSVTFSTNGTLQTRDISRAHIFVLNNRNFQEVDWIYESVATPIENPDGNFTFSFPQPLTIHQDSTFLFVTYDISGSAGCGNQFDITAVSFNMGALYTPGISSVTGNRSLIPCATIDSMKVTLNPTGVIRAGQTKVLSIDVSVYKNTSGYIRMDTLVLSTQGCSRPADIRRAFVEYITPDHGKLKESQIYLVDTVEYPSGEMTFVFNQGIADTERVLKFSLYYDISDSALSNDTIDAQCIRAYCNSVTKYPLIAGLSGFRTIFEYLSGTKIIGTGGDFATFRDAFNALREQNVSAAGVVFDVKGQDFTEALPILSSSINTSGGSIVFRKKPGEIRNPKLYARADTVMSYLVRLNALDNFTWDGIDIDASAAPTYALFSAGNVLSNGVDNLTIKNCRFIGNSTGPYGAYGILLLSTVPGSNGKLSNITMKNLFIGNVAYGIYVASTSAKPSENVYIGTEGTGTMQIGSADYPVRQRTSSYGPVGIYILNGRNSTIENTEISNVVGGVYSVLPPAAIRLNNAQGSENSIRNNKLHDLTQTDSTTPNRSIFGISAELNESVSGSRLQVANNLIYRLRHMQESVEDSCRVLGMYFYSLGSVYESSVEVYHNSVLIDSVKGVSSTACMYKDLDATIRNNIFANTSTTYSGARGSAIIAQTGLKASYNNYYVPTGISNKYIGILKTGSSAIQYSTLAGWQSALLSDSGSYNTNPGFVSDSDLHISYSNNLVPTIGVPVGITTDYFGNSRDAVFPYIGAHESPVAATVNKLVLQVLLEGYYNPALGRMDNTDTVTVFLRRGIAPYQIVDSVNVIPSYTGLINVLFTNTYADSLYRLSFKHRNSISVWTADGYHFTGRIMTVTMTDAAAKAFGSNLRLRSDKYCIPGGDVNGDGAVTIQDMQLVDTHAVNFSTGYIQADVTGDGIVDLSDAVLCDNNAQAGIVTIAPSGAK